MKITRNGCSDLARRLLIPCIALLLFAGAASEDEYLPWEGGPAYYAKWANGPRSDPDSFPIAVWLQSPNNASFKAFHHRSEPLDREECPPMPALGLIPPHGEEMEDHLQKQEE